jgi:hypothetical protein
MTWGKVMAGFDVDTSVLRAQGNSFVGIGTTFGAASKRLQDSLEAQGEPWSTDDLGEMFGTIYTPVRDAMFESMDSLGEQLQGVGHKLEAMAATYDQSDDDNAHGMDVISI